MRSPWKPVEDCKIQKNTATLMGLELMKQIYEAKVSWKAVVIQFFLYEFAINMLTIARKRTLISLPPQQWHIKWWQQLVKLTIHVLSIITNTGGCKHTFSHFSTIHSKLHNKLPPKNAHKTLTMQMD